MRVPDAGPMPSGNRVGGVVVFDRDTAMIIELGKWSEKRTKGWVSEFPGVDNLSRSNRKRLIRQSDFDKAVDLVGGALPD